MRSQGRKDKRLALWCVLVAAVVTVSGGCSSGGSRPSTFSIRAVNGEQLPPCAPPPKPSTNAGVLPLVEQGKTVSCLHVAQAPITQKDVTSASAVDGASGWQVDFVLDKSGADALDQLAAAHLGDKLAMEVGGVVYNTPPVHTSQFNGRGAISGLDETTAKRIASELHSA